VNRRWLSFFGVALAGAVLDVATKSLVFSRFELGETVPVVPGILSIQLTENRGIVWGLMPSPVWMAVSLAAAPVIAFVFLRRAPSWPGRWGTAGTGWSWDGCATGSSCGRSRTSTSPTRC
jgi:signal peptidase II